MFRGIEPRSMPKRTAQSLQYISLVFTRTVPEIRLIAHSLGAAVVDESLVNLSNNSKWKGKIASVHLLGAAIYNTLIRNHTSALVHVVHKFYNLYNPEDDGLKVNQ